jgi:hypothetical protein
LVMRDGRIVAAFTRGVSDVDVLSAAAGRLRDETGREATDGH